MPYLSKGAGYFYINIKPTVDECTFTVARQLTVHDAKRTANWGVHVTELVVRLLPSAAIQLEYVITFAWRHNVCHVMSPYGNAYIARVMLRQCCRYLQRFLILAYNRKVSKSLFPDSLFWEKVPVFLLQSIWTAETFGKFTLTILYGTRSSFKKISKMNFPKLLFRK